MKVLVDEMYDGWEDKIIEFGYEAQSAKKLIVDKTIQYCGDRDTAIRKYAKQNNMIIVTSDVGMGKKCNDLDIGCILASADKIFDVIVKQELKSMS